MQRDQLDRDVRSLIRRTAGTHALTLRIPDGEYDLLRALAFSSGSTINQVVLSAVAQLLDQGNTRQVLESILQTARDARGTNQLPRNPHGHGPKKPKDGS